MYRKEFYGLCPQQNPYNKEIMIRHYEKHNSDVKNYFADNKDNLLVINVASKDSYFMLCDFIGKKPIYSEFPWENKASDFGLWKNIL